VIDPVADPRWLELVRRAPGATIFHHPAWLRLLRDTYRYEMSACVVGDAGLPIAAVTGRRLVALPFSDLCPPLGETPELARALEAFRDGRPLELRGGFPDATPGERFHHHVLALEPDVEAVVRRFARSQALRGVRRARREGLTCERRIDEAALRSFYALHMRTRRRLGVPTQPRRFILALERLFADGLGFVLLVRAGERPVAGAVFLTFGGVLTYKYGASDERFLGSRPNNLLFMEAIRWGCEHGMRTLDFGRTHWGQEGLRAFKLAWGAEERELRYRHLGAVSGHHPQLERLLGGAIRRSPPLAGRVIGEVLYRHAG
jgi:CelD/BcsL family acetyltransferase involved in cellulose biosynthesis